ncbi:MAG: hypothetical protein Fur0010_18080 [Bdellovibrio sp.]
MEQDFLKYLKDSNLDVHQVVLCLKDGTVLMENQRRSRNGSQELIALVVGAVAATEQISKIVSKDRDEFAMSFSSSSGGVYAIPTKSRDGVELYVMIIFSNVTNPGQLKIKLKKLSDFCIDHLVVKNEKEKVLFDNITDEEIDIMFQGCKV